MFRFAEKLVNAESICDVLVESLFTVFDSSIPLKEYAIAVFENVSSLVDNFEIHRNLHLKYFQKVDLLLVKDKLHEYQYQNYID